MSDTEQNVELLRHCYTQWDATKGGSTQDWMSILADEVDFRSLAMAAHPSANFTAPLTAKSDVAQYFEGLLSQWQMIHYTVEDYVAQDDKVCAIATTAWTFKSTGKTIETPKVDVWRFKDEKAVAFFEFYDTALLFSAAEAD